MIGVTMQAEIRGRGDAVIDEDGVDRVCRRRCDYQRWSGLRLPVR